MTSIAKRSMFSLRLPVSVTIGLALALVIVLLSLLSSYIAPFDPMRMASGPRLSAPSAAHLFGTDEFGRDLFSRVLLGGRLSLGIGLSAVVSGLVIGGLIGLIAAFGGRVVEALLLRLIDVLYSFPDTLIALALVAFLGPGIENATLAIAISLVPFYARVAYGLAAAERAKPYIEAARLAGTRSARLVRVHVMPNIVQSLIVMATLGFSSAILSAAGLSFLGLGVQPPSPEWGAILASGRNYITKAPWILIFPGLAICLTVLSFNLIGDSLRDLIDPRRKARP
ncbi:ABC transporter permease subunit [Agrobacterium vitis]|uniref:ABC transporter permease n=1 Tax=Rhizobium/Agrobacterium group TaxID=227290 RepID=UPI0008DC0D84|nr:MULTISPECIES: ABC transporter permease [Rhizobium/Agrobacterium group]MCF1432657.1 ABC transporter permease [Allorhizobium ampelinum]MUO90167.1 ABC transporter permease subunit [Agrobacterium vitis]MUZ51064.1 ABC transporter permease subunit [Agrobacterium vitis]MUZ90609.1 ABC transporter permease subunit [Agrobacterium vitis]MVA38555.1 ABC transporter permease subunit [Agrobacterium vitis]